jgi:hypothetical protein
MSFPGQKARDPWRMTRAVEKATFVQDLISAMTHLLHGGELSERERVAVELLRDTGNEEAFEEQLVEDAQLEPTGSPALIRTARTALPKDPDSRRETVRALNLALQGEVLDKSGLELISALRKAFIEVARTNFESISAAKHSDGELGLWEPLRTSSSF